MVLVSADNVLRRAVKRLTTAMGASSQFVEHENELRASKPIDLAIFDARDRGPESAFTNQLSPRAKILYVLDGRVLPKGLHLFDSPQTTSLFCHGKQLDDDEFISSATKAIRGDVFGLQKYFPWGVTTFTMLIRNYEEKTKAINIMLSYAKTAGVRAPVRDRIQLVADELLMNALYHAPVDERGNELHADITPKELAQRERIAPIEVQYGCSGRFFGISVRDGFGSLTREKALHYLQRASAAEATIEEKKSGAGLGLISVLKSVSKLVFNLDPGYSTEVIGLFDMEFQAKDKGGARSLHIFTAARSTFSPKEGLPTVKRSSAPWMLIAALSLVVAFLAGVYFWGDQAEVATTTTIQVVATPADSVITINGAPVSSSEMISVPQKGESLTILVQKKGYQDWTKTLNTSSLATSSSVYVDLHPQ